MIIRKNLLKITLFFVQFCFGQFFYTGYLEEEKWKSVNDQNYSGKDTINFWYFEKKRKFIDYKNIQHFGLFINFKNNSNSNILQQKSDFIGNGILTNYRFSFDKIRIVNSMFFTYDGNEAKRGYVRTIKNISMYTNQAYINFYNHSNYLGYSFKLGRDFLIEGFGNSAKIFFSDFSRPFDQIRMDANFKNFHSKISIISLDKLYYNKRYLYMHTFSYNFKKISLTIGEAVISSSISESVDIKFLNPFNFWSWENIGSTDEGLNALLYGGFLLKPDPSLNIYGELLIDDINFHQKNAFYLNRYAYLLGIQKTSFPFALSNFWFEISNVINQVYQSYHPSHIFTHRGYPIGHYLGNDFINYRLHYSQHLESKINKVFFDFSYLIRGQNNLNTPFDNPWEDINGKFNENYKHPGFPTPPLEYLYDLLFGFEFAIKEYTFLNISFEGQKNHDMNFQKKIRIRFWSYLNVIK